MKKSMNDRDAIEKLNAKAVQYSTVMSMQHIHHTNIPYVRLHAQIMYYIKLCNIMNNIMICIFFHTESYQ